MKEIREPKAGEALSFKYLIKLKLYQLGIKAGCVMYLCKFASVRSPRNPQRKEVGVPLGILPHVLGLALVTPPTRSYRRSPSVPGLEQTFLTPRPVQS